MQTTGESPTLAALTAYTAARDAFRASEEAFQAAATARKKATEAYRLARYLATVAVPCPYCAALVGQPCAHNHKVHPYVTHGMRQDASGVNGPFE